MPNNIKSQHNIPKIGGERTGERTAVNCSAVLLKLIVLQRIYAISLRIMHNVYMILTKIISITYRSRGYMFMIHLSGR